MINSIKRKKKGFYCIKHTDTYIIQINNLKFSNFYIWYIYIHILTTKMCTFKYRQITTVLTIIKTMYISPIIITF